MNTIKQELTLAQSGIKAAIDNTLALNLKSEEVKVLNNVLYKIAKAQTQLHYDTVDIKIILKRFYYGKPRAIQQYKRF